MSPAAHNRITSSSPCPLGRLFSTTTTDGFLDLFVVNGTRLEYQPEDARNRLFHNEPGAGDARVFRQVEADLGTGGWGMGCAAGDYDNDGDVDLYVTYWGPNQLWRNEGWAALPKLRLLPAYMTGAGAPVPPLAMLTAMGGSIYT